MVIIVAGLRRRAPPEPTDILAGAPRVYRHELDGHFDRSQSGRATPRHLDGELHHYSQGTTAVAGVVAGLSPAQPRPR